MIFKYFLGLTTQLGGLDLLPGDQPTMECLSQRLSDKKTAQLCRPQ
jgi:hypothetical protein